MTTIVDIINRALQNVGTRTTITQTELDEQSSNEAIQAKLIYNKLRQDLLRMAPWDCGFNYQNIVVITSLEGNPVRSWIKGLPPPPWAYEYQYPVDCLRACWIVPNEISAKTQLAVGTPDGIPPIKFKVGIDQFYPVVDAMPYVAGTGYVPGEVITLVSPVPYGAPAKIRVLTVTAGGVATCEVVNHIEGSEIPHGGSYFSMQSNPVAQASSTGNGTGATFNLVFGAEESQRVIWTNQSNAILAYIKDIENINTMDPLFKDAWGYLIGSRLTLTLTGDKTLAQMLVTMTNNAIIEARKVDGNEGLTVNDTVPDFLRIRGSYWNEGFVNQSAAFEWGGLFPAIV